MRAVRFLLAMMLFVGLAALMLHACAPASGSSDPPVTPDTTIPSTLQANVTINEHQDASDGIDGSSDITLQFSSNEISETNTVIFTHGETLNCFFNNHESTVALGSATSYSLHVAISNNPFTYKCDYHYTFDSESEQRNIFKFNSPQMPLSPVLMRPVGKNSNSEVIYNPGNPSPNVNPCTVQVTANAPNGSINGATVPQGGNIYSGPDTGGLNGLGNIVMTRICTPVSFNHHNSPDDHSSAFDVVKVTFTSTASSEVCWYSPNNPPNTPSQCPTS